MSAPKTCPPALMIAATVRPSVGKAQSCFPVAASSAKNPPGFPPVANTTLPATSGVAWLPSPTAACQIGRKPQPGSTCHAVTPLPRRAPSLPRTVDWPDVDHLLRLGPRRRADERSDPVAERQAVYTNLAPGHYRFRVIASNSDGTWNGTEAVLPFEVRAMFWQTAWFRLSVLAAAGLAGWGIYRLRVRRLAAQLNVRFEERLAERTQIARELHDTLLQGFLSASMQLHVAASRLPDDAPAKPALSRVLDLMRTVIEDGRKAVQGLRSSSSAPHELEQAFAGAQQEIGVSDADYRVIVEGRPRSLNPIIRDEVYRIGREALVNAFRHSGAAHIEIELEYGPQELSVFVRDDGRGVDPDVIRTGSDGHWGIIGMRERAQRIGGHLKIRSRAAAGTEVELRIPAHVAFERQARGAGTEQHS